MESTIRYPCTYEYCDKTYKNKACLRAHIKRIHLYTLDDILPDEDQVKDKSKSRPKPKAKAVAVPNGDPKCKCNTCGRTFTSPQNKRNHRLSVHGVAEKYIPRTNVICNECTPNQTFRTLSEYREHLTTHGISIKKVMHNFTSESDFMQWKGRLEMAVGVNYVPHGGAKVTPNGSKQIYYCRRSSGGSASRKNAKDLKRAGKRQGTCKIGQFCTSSIDVMRYDGRIEVVHFVDHHNHDLDYPSLVHMNLPKLYRDKIAGMIAQGMPFKKILATMQETFGKSRASLLNTNDLRNILKRQVEDICVVAKTRNLHARKESNTRKKNSDIKEAHLNFEEVSEETKKSAIGKSNRSKKRKKPEGLVQPEKDCRGPQKSMKVDCDGESEDLSWVKNNSDALVVRKPPSKTGSIKAKTAFETKEVYDECGVVSKDNSFSKGSIQKPEESAQTKKAHQNVFKEESECVSDSLDAAKGEYVSSIAKTLREIKDLDAFQRVKIEIRDILLDALAGHYSNSALEKQAKNSVLEKSSNNLPVQKEAKNSPLEERSNNSTLEKQSENSALEYKGNNSGVEMQAINFASKKRGNNSALEKRSKYSSLEKRCHNSVLEKNANSVKSLEAGNEPCSEAVPSLFINNKETSTLRSVDKVSNSETGLSFQQLTGEIPKCNNAIFPEMTKSSSSVSLSCSDKDFKVAEKTIGVSKTPVITQNVVLVRDHHGSLSIVPASSVVCITAKNIAGSPQIPHSAREMKVRVPLEAIVRSKR